jgi:translocation and assembly module TamB
LDVARIGRLAGVPEILRGGSISLEADLRGSPRAMHGSLKTRVRSLAVLGSRNASADLDVRFSGRTLDARVLASLDGAGRLALAATDFELPPGEFDARTLRDAEGEIYIDTELDLARLVELVPAELRPFDHGSGKISLQATFHRKRAGALPDLDVKARTTGLELIGKGTSAPIEDRKQARKEKPWHVKETDATLELKVEGDSGRSNLYAQAFDRHGTLLTVRADSTLPHALLHARGAALRELLYDLPIEAEVAIPRRELSRLPLPVRPAGVVGAIEASLKAGGTARQPRLELSTRGHGLRSKDPSFPTALDVMASLHYANARTHIGVAAHRNGGAALLARSRVDADLKRLIETGGKDAALRADADVTLHGFPLRAVPMLKERLVHGDISGTLVLRDLGRDASLQGSANVDGLVLGGVQCRTARLELNAGRGKLDGKVELAHGDGHVRAKLSSGLVWGPRLAPEIDDRSPTRTEIEAKNFRIGTLQPFVAEQVSTLDGRLDAALRTSSAAGRTVVLGNAQLRQGIVQIPAIGQEFHDVRARVTASEGGVLKVRDAQARGRQGRVRAAAAARLDGLTLRTARAEVAIAEHEKLPLTTQGVEIGDAWGSMEATLVTSADGKTTTVNVRSEKFHLDLPDTKQNKVQGLQDAANVRIGVRLDREAFQTLPLQPLEEPKEPGAGKLILNVRLSKDVWVRQGTTAKVKLGGSIRVEVAAEARVTGRIRIGRGTLDVSGKRFEIEQGTVTFQAEDPANPIVVATARYDSPEGYRVYADFVGPVKTGKLKLRSEPPLVEDEILSLLLFGTPDGSFGGGAGEGSTAATAVGVGGATATQGLNAALSDLTDLDVSTRVDTSRGSPTPELVIQLTRRLSAQLGYNLGDPSPGRAPDRTFITLDLRIQRRWSLATTVGDHGGTGVDAVWRHRY